MVDRDLEVMGETNLFRQKKVNMEVEVISMLIILAIIEFDLCLFI
jgi:hypothetical protein